MHFVDKDRRASEARLGVALVVGLAVLGSAIAAPPAARADLDVHVPPGTPLDWLRELPARTPLPFSLTAGRALEPAAPGAAREPTTGPREGAPRPAGAATRRLGPGARLGTIPRGGATWAPLVGSGVLTADVVEHIPGLGRRAADRVAVYPPQVTDDLYWLAQAALLRRALYPAYAPAETTLVYLTALGHAAREAASAAEGEPALAGLAGAVLAAIPRLPREGPEPPALAGATPEQAMRLRLVRDELAYADALTLDPAFARRLLLLGEGLLPELAAALESPHPLLRRNAVVLVGGHASGPAGEEALAALRARFRSDDDAVVRVRALDQLVRAGDPGLVPDLVRVLGDKRERARAPLAAWALGQLGAREALPALTAVLGDSAASPAALGAACLAIARIGRGADGADADAARAALRKLARSLGAAAPRFQDRSAFDSAYPPPALTNRALLEQAVLGLEALGADEGAFAKLAAGAWQHASRPTGHANAVGPLLAAEPAPFDKMAWSSHLGACEPLARAGPEALALLQAFFESGRGADATRLSLLPIIGHAGLYDRVIDNPTTNGAVRAYALELLVQADLERGAAAARRVLEAYGGTRVLGAGDAGVIAALRALGGRLLPADLDLLRAAVARAADDERELAGRRVAVSAAGLAEYVIAPSLLDAAILALGETRDARALAALEPIARDPRHAGRWPAALALGAVPGSEPALLALLGDDRDGFVRYLAFVGLRARTGEQAFADWIYGPSAEREAARARHAAAVEAKAAPPGRVAPEGAPR